MSDDSDVVHVSNELKELTVADLMKSDEELAQMLQVFFIIFGACVSIFGLWEWFKHYVYRVCLCLGRGGSAYVARVCSEWTKWWVWAENTALYQSSTNGNFKFWGLSFLFFFICLVTEKEIWVSKCFILFFSIKLKKVFSSICSFNRKIMCNLFFFFCFVYDRLLNHSHTR